MNFSGLADAAVAAAVGIGGAIALAFNHIFTVRRSAASTERAHERLDELDDRLGELESAIAKQMVTRDEMTQAMARVHLRLDKLFDLLADRK